jgi:hypothetical protein
MDQNGLHIDLPDLETRCDSCEGRGGEEERGRWCPCPTCDGTGYIPTEAGKRILAIVRHNFRTLYTFFRQPEHL